MERKMENNTNNLCCICKTDYRPHALVDLQELGRGHYQCYIIKYHPDMIAPCERDDYARIQSLLDARRLQLQRNSVDEKHETESTKTQATQTSSNGKQSRILTLILDGIKYEIDDEWAQIKNIDYKKTHNYIRHKCSIQPERSFKAISNETFAELFVWILLGKNDNTAPWWYISNKCVWNTIDIINTPSFMLPNKSSMEVKCKEETQDVWFGHPKRNGFMACVDHKISKDRKHFYKLSVIRCDGNDFKLISPFDKKLTELGFEHLADYDIAQAAWTKYTKDDDDEDFMDTLTRLDKKSNN